MSQRGHLFARGISGRRRTLGAAPWTPAELGAAVIDWYAPASYDAGTPAWNDLGPGGRTLSVVTNNPATGVALNGRSTRVFSGSAALKHTVGTIDHATTAIDVYLAGRPDLVATTQLMCDSHTSSGRLSMQVVSPGVFRANAGTNISSASNTLKADTPTLFRLRANGLTSQLFVWSGGAWVAASAVATINTTAWTGLTLGAAHTLSSAFPGAVAEFLRVTASGHDPDQVGAYFAAEYPALATYGWTPVDLLVGGDSNWIGIGSTDGRGARSIIHSTFEAADVEPGVRTLRQVGPARDACLSSFAASGRVIATVRDGIAAQIAAYAPDAIVLWIGTNDCQGDDGAYDATTTPAKLYSTLDNIDGAGHTGPVVVVQIPPLANGTHNANVNDFNDEITRAGGMLDYGIGLGLDMHTADLNTGISTSTHMDDGTHLNDAGYALGTPRLVSVLRAALA